MSYTISKNGATSFAANKPLLIARATSIICAGHDGLSTGSLADGGGDRSRYALARERCVRYGGDGRATRISDAGIGKGARSVCLLAFCGRRRDDDRAVPRAQGNGRGDGLLLVAHVDGL